MSVWRKITFNTLIAIGARAIDTFFALILVTLLTRYLGKTGYGYYATVLAYLQIFVSLINLGLYNIFLRDIGKPKTDESNIASNIFSLRLFGAFLILPIALLVVSFLPYPPMLQLGIYIASLATLFLSLYQVLVPIFQKHLKIAYVSFAELAGRIAYLSLAALLLMQFHTGFIPIIWAMVLSSLINFLLVFYFAKRFVSIKVRIDWKKWRKTLRESLPIGASVIFTLIYFRIDTVMLSLMKAPQDVGIYSLAYKILENLIFLPAILVGFTVPLLSRYFLENKRQFKQTFQVTLNFLLLLLIPLVTGLVIIALPIVHLLGGKAFSASAPVLKILAIAIGFIFLGNLYGQTVIILKKQVWSMWIYCAGAILNIAANLYFIPRYSYMGAAFTTVITEFFITSMLIFIVTQNLKYLPSFRIVIKILGAVLPMVVFLYFFKDINIFALIAISFLIYGAVIYMEGGISKKDIGFLVTKANP